MAHAVAAQNTANLSRKSSQKPTPVCSPYDADSAASIIRAMKSDSIEDPTLSMTLELRCSP